jgi:hypothetical protein
MRWLESSLCSGTMMEGNVRSKSWLLATTIRMDTKGKSQVTRPYVIRVRIVTIRLL